jgi:hypothetical protein
MLYFSTFTKRVFSRSEKTLLVKVEKYNILRC